MAVPEYKAAGGIILTASHNPVEWNALKLLNHRGEFVTHKDGLEILEILENKLYPFKEVRELGVIKTVNGYTDKHIEKIKEINLVDSFAIQKAGLKIVVDGVNSTGGLYVPDLLKALGVEDIVKINCEPTGWFTHNPEPVKKNLTELCEFIRDEGADLGIAVDPDVDRLVLVDEKGRVIWGRIYPSCCRGLCP